MTKFVSGHNNRKLVDIHIDIASAKKDSSRPAFHKMIEECKLVVVKVSGSKALNAKKYASILTVKTSAFKEDLSESLSTDSIALMDTQSARMLGDREIGSLSGVVSQFDVSDDYIQIDYCGKPIKGSTLDYAGFFKWINNRKNGVAGYVSPPDGFGGGIKPQGDPPEKPGEKGTSSNNNASSTASQKSTASGSVSKTSGISSGSTSSKKTKKSQKTSSTASAASSKSSSTAQKTTA